MPFAPGSKVRYLWREEGAGATVTKIFRSAVVLAFLPPVAAMPFRKAREAVLRTVEERTPGADGIDHVSTRVEEVEPAVPERAGFPGAPGLYRLEVTFLPADLPSLGGWIGGPGTGKDPAMLAVIGTTREIACSAEEVFAP